MINGDLDNFLEEAYGARTLFFLYDGKKYLYRGHVQEDGSCILLLTELEPEYELRHKWVSNSQKKNIEDFFKAKIFNGKTFWEVEKEIEWVDC